MRHGHAAEVLANRYLVSSTCLDHRRDGGYPRTSSLAANLQPKIRDYLCSTLPRLANFPINRIARAHALRLAAPKLKIRRNLAMTSTLGRKARELQEVSAEAVGIRDFLTRSLFGGGVWGTWGLLRDSVNMALDAVPPGVDVAGVHNYFRSLSGVTDFHHLHIWSLTTTN